MKTSISSSSITQNKVTLDDKIYREDNKRKERNGKKKR